MKRIHQQGLMLAATALLCGAAIAQEDQEPGAEAAWDSAIEYERYLGETNLRASDLVGAPVKNADGQDLGEVEDLIISRDDDVVTAVVSVGGIFGLGSKTIGVPYSDFRVATDGTTLYLDMNAERLRQQPEFEYAERVSAVQPAPLNDRASASAQTDAGSDARSGAQPDTLAAPEADTQAAAGSETHAAAEPDTQAAAGSDTHAAAEPDTHAGADPLQTASGVADSPDSRSSNAPSPGTSGRSPETQPQQPSQARAQPLEPQPSDAQSGQPQVEQSQSQAAGPSQEDVQMMARSDHRASEIIGITVIDSEGREVGEVDDLIVSPDDGEIHAVLAIGGILGLGERLVSVPLRELDLGSGASRDAAASSSGSAAARSDSEIAADDAEDRESVVRLDVTGNELLESRPEFRYQGERTASL